MPGALAEKSPPHCSLFPNMSHPVCSLHLIPALLLGDTSLGPPGHRDLLRAATSLVPRGPVSRAHPRNAIFCAGVLWLA